MQCEKDKARTYNEYLIRGALNMHLSVEDFLCTDDDDDSNNNKNDNNNNNNNNNNILEER
jgi:hypothetical protein